MTRLAIIAALALSACVHVDTPVSDRGSYTPVEARPSGPAKCTNCGLDPNIGEKVYDPNATY